DHHRHWIIEFNRRLGLCFVFNAELWDILDGLTVLHNRSWDKVLIRTDSVEVIQVIQVVFSRSSNSALIRRIQTYIIENGSMRNVTYSSRREYKG
ncbi:hypothetical protein Gohar_025981, partial [Gossypium harknessii]|nr:hypothetical protein [Gossypium harknessii]